MRLRALTFLKRYIQGANDEDASDQPNKNPKKLFFPVIALVFLVAGATGGLDYAVNNTPLSAVDRGAAEYAGSIAKQGTVVYGSLRAINSALFYAKSVDTGVGLTFHPLAFVEGYKDTIEMVSNVLLAAAASGYIYNFVLDFGALAGLSVLLPAGLALLLTAQLQIPSAQSNIPGLIYRLGRLLIGWFVVLRVGVPLALFLASGLDSAVLEERHREATQNVASAAEE